VNSVEVKELAVGKSHVVQGEMESLPGIRGTVAKRMPSLFNPFNMQQTPTVKTERKRKRESSLSGALSRIVKYVGLL
jgi:hypothetical protein